MCVCVCVALLVNLRASRWVEDKTQMSNMIRQQLESSPYRRPLHALSLSPPQGSSSGWHVANFVCFVMCMLHECAHYREDVLPHYFSFLGRQCTIPLNNRSLKSNYFFLKAVSSLCQVLMHAHAFCVFRQVRHD